MGRGKDLTEKEKGKIDLLLKHERSISGIAKEISRSRSLVRHYIADPDSYGSKRHDERKKSSSPRMIRRIIRMASNKIISSGVIKENTGCNVSKKTVCRYLTNTNHFKYVKMQSKPPLTEKHKINRLEYARIHTGWCEKWQNVVFSDEKKFNLDGPDGFHCYWHDLRREKLIFSKRLQNGGSVMIWGGFSSKGKTSLVFIETTIDSIKYQEILRRNLIPFGSHFHSNDYIFQQDNAPCHASRSTIEWLENKGIDVMSWPPYSPDLNPIENLWGYLSRKVYEDGKQYSTVRELKDSLIKAWNEIPLSYLQNLVNSMPSRLFEISKSQGASINY